MNLSPSFSGDKNFGMEEEEEDDEEESSDLILLHSGGRGVVAAVPRCFLSREANERVCSLFFVLGVLELEVELVGVVVTDFEF